MLSLILSAFGILALLAASGAMWMALRQQARLRAELGQTVVELAVLHEKLRHAQESFTSQVERIAARQDTESQRSADLAERFLQVEMHAGLCVPPKPAPSGFNINKRVEVIRLFQDGFREEEIAEQLAVPLGEVRLLIYLERNQNASATPRRRGGANGSCAA